MLSRSIALLTTVLLASACASMPQAIPATPASSETNLFEAANAIQDQWQHLLLRGETDYRLAFKDGRISIRAEGRNSASGLIRRIAIDTVKCPIMEWSWAVTQMQPSADLRVKNREDVAASVFLLFGDPGFPFDLKAVPTLRYVWTNENVPAEAIVDNPYLPGTVQSIVIESGTDRIGTWVTERRNVVEDYTLAFGSEPKDGIRAIALFTDNDQTKEPVEAYYGSGHMVCTRS